MKRVILLLGISISLILINVSCNKQHDDIDMRESQIDQMDPYSQHISSKIQRFKADMESHLKTGNDYSIDSAVWYVEATINYTYADTANNLMGLDMDSAFIQVSLTDGKVTTSSAAAAFDKFVDSLTVQYQNLPSQSGHLIFADIFPRDSTSGSVTFGMISAFGYGTPIIYGPFGEEDWWMFGWGWCNNGGYCGESIYEGTHTDDDAAFQIARRIRASIGVPAGRYTPTDVVTLEITPDGTVDDVGELDDDYYCDFLNPEDLITEDNNYDYLLMYKYSGYQNFESCLCPDEMNFYYYGTRDVCYENLFDCLPDLLDGKELISIDMIGNNTYGDTYFYLHIITNTYGILVFNPNPPPSWE